jgi:hypothetical protein
MRYLLGKREGEPVVLHANDLLAPVGRSVSIQIIEDVEILTGLPTGYPSWILWLAFFPVIGGIAIGFIYEWNLLVDVAGGQFAAMAIVVLIALFLTIVILGCVVFVASLNKQIVDHGPFFHADRLGRWLSLPRLDLKINRDRILSLVEIRSIYVMNDVEGSSSERLGEISVLITGRTGEIERYPVVTALRIDVVEKVGQKLAELFQVQCVRKT